MKLNIYAVYDYAAQRYSQPWYFTHTGEAIRYFNDIALKESSIFIKHLEDFALYILGSFNDESGEFKSQTPERVIEAKDFKKDKDNG